MKSLYHSILDDEAVISKQTDDDIIANIVRKFCTHQGGLSTRSEGSEWDYDADTHTIILRPEQSMSSRIIIPVINNLSGRGPELTWCYSRSEEVPCVDKSGLINKDLYNMGLTVSDIHVKFEGSDKCMDTIRFMGIPDTKKKCTDIDGFSNHISSLVFYIEKRADTWDFDCSVLGNLKYIMPNVIIDNLMCPCIDIKANCKGIPSHNIISYHIDGGSKGFMYGNKPFFSREDDEVIVNPEIDEQEVIDSIVKFSKNNPKVDNIHTIRAHKRVDLRVQESAKERKIIFSTKM